MDDILLDILEGIEIDGYISDCTSDKTLNKRIVFCHRRYESYRLRTRTSLTLKSIGQKLSISKERVRQNVAYVSKRVDRFNRNKSFHAAFFRSQYIIECLNDLEIDGL